MIGKLQKILNKTTEEGTKTGVQEYITYILHDLFC